MGQLVQRREAMIDVSECGLAGTKVIFVNIVCHSFPPS